PAAARPAGGSSAPSSTSPVGSRPSHPPHAASPGSDVRSTSETCRDIRVRRGSSAIALSRVEDYVGGNVGDGEQEGPDDNRDCCVSLVKLLLDVNPLAEQVEHEIPEHQEGDADEAEDHRPEYRPTEVVRLGGLTEQREREGHASLGVSGPARCGSGGAL